MTDSIDTERPTASDRSSPPSLEGPTSVNWKLWALLVVPFLLYGVALSLLSDGNYHDDDTSHFLIARRAWQAPTEFLSVWGRPGFTIPYAFLAWIGGPYSGLLLCRLLSVALAAAIAAITSAMAARLRIPNPEWAGLFTLWVPLHFQLSITTLTETVCAFYLISATLLLTEGRPRAAALVLSLTMLTRHEAIVFVFGASLLFLWRRDWLAALLVWTSELAWNLVTFLTTASQLPWTRYRPGSDQGYGSAGPLWSMVMWLEAAGPVIMALTAVGAWTLLWQLRLNAPPEGTASVDRSNSVPAAIPWWDGRGLSSVDLGRLLVVIGALGIVLLNTLLYMFNKFASGGYARFLVPATPWMALCALVGWNTLRSRIFGATSPLSQSRLMRVYLGTFFACALVGLAVLFVSPDRRSLAFSINFLYGPRIFLIGAGVATIGLLSRSRMVFRGGLMVAALAWPISWSGSALPLWETETQRLYVTACQWVSERPEFARLPATCLSPTGELHVEQSGLNVASIWLEPSTSKPALILKDNSVWLDLPLRKRLDGMVLRELTRFAVPGAPQDDPQRSMVIYEAAVRADQPTALNEPPRPTGALPADSKSPPVIDLAVPARTLASEH